MLLKNGYPLYQMPRKKLLHSLLLILCASGLLIAQDGPSLGDVARRLRAEKESAKPAAPASSTNPAKTQVAPSTATPQPVTAGKPDTATNLYAPYGSREEFNLHFLDHYKQGIRALLEQEKFETLDQMADPARSSKTRLPGGFWVLHNIYVALSEPAVGTFKATESDFTTLIARLQHWVEQQPDSVTARIALAEAYIQYASNARGGGYADSVSQDGWRLNRERTETAANILMDAAKLPTKCPEWYLAMQYVARILGESKEMQTAVFEKAAAFEPDYYYYYLYQAETLLPKWEGEEGEATAFAEQVADRIGGKKGDMMYFEIATTLNCGCETDSHLYGMSWPRIKSGYQALEQQYGEAIEHLNSMAYMAAVAGDGAYSEELFGRIKEGWDPEVWHEKQRFLITRQWAQGWGTIKSIEGALKSADDNVRTPEGQKFDKQVATAFASNYSTAVDECWKASGEPFLIPFDMAVQVGKNGAVEKVFTSLTSHTSTCLSARVEKGSFPVPPSPDYWIKISLQARR